MIDMGRLMERASAALAAAGYADVGLEMPTPGVLVATHADAARAALAQAVLDAFDKRWRKPRAIQAVYLDITARLSTATQATYLKILRYMLAERAVDKPDLFKQLASQIPELADVLGDEAES
jgi:hypothetical protein